MGTFGQKGTRLPLTSLASPTLDPPGWVTGQTGEVSPEPRLLSPISHDLALDFGKSLLSVEQDSSGSKSLGMGPNLARFPGLSALKAKGAPLHAYSPQEYLRTLA